MAVPKWHMKGALVGACSCEWGCPCNFDANPSQGFCEGSYSIVVREGRYGNVPLDGLKFVWAGHAPGPVHEGNLTSLIIIDEQATSAQRDAMLALWKGGGVGLPFDIFASVTATWLEPIIAPIEVKLDGINSTVRVAGGTLWDVAISRIRNPVTGDEEEIYLDKPTGFTSLRSELGMSAVMRLEADGLSFDHSGRYGEYADFEYSGP